MVLRLNWTKVGLKVDHRVIEDQAIRQRLNWTKVGLKAPSTFTKHDPRGGLNWTKVGLKVADHIHHLTILYYV